MGVWYRSDNIHVLKHKITSMSEFDNWEPEKYVEDGEETDVVEEHDTFGVE